MSDPETRRQLYRPLQATPEQEARIGLLVEQLGAASGEADTAEIPADPSSPTAS